MTFAGPLEAKQFFVDKILAEAGVQSVPISAAERYMLSWSESDPEFHRNAVLTTAFEAETNAAKFEEKAVRIVREAYARDLRSDPRAREKWRAAYQTLRSGDHYLLVMLREALGWRLRKWFVF